MRLARFWARGSWQGASARGWPDESVEAAGTMAREHARRLAERLASGGEVKQYLYGERPLPEPVLEEMEGAAVTRNAYGARVLNTGSLMFVDVDGGETDASKGVLGGLRSLFSKDRETKAASSLPLA